jgi:hypothetical protein
MKRKCALPECGISIPKSRHGNATTCCKSHAKLLKVIREKNNYQKIRQYATSNITNGNNEKRIEQKSIFNEMEFKDQFPKKNPKALNLKLLEKIGKPVTLGFKVEPHIKLKLAKKASEYGLSLSTYVNNLLTSEEDNFTEIKHKAGRPKKYSTPELISSIITNETIELVYKIQQLVHKDIETPNPEVYKDIYNRFNGSVRRVIGTYIPVKAESFEF